MARGLRINYIAYIDPFAHPGGGEMVMRAFLEAGARQGHEIRRSAVFPRGRHDAFPAPDFTILADIYNIPKRWWSRLPSSALQGIIETGRYVHFDNAYVDVCDLPYLPCNGAVASEICPFKRRRWFGDRQCFRVRAAEMYRNARLNVFLSPLHRKTVQKLLGPDLIGDYFEMRPVIDTGRFKNLGRKRDIDHLFLGYFNEAKGADNLIRAFPSGNVVLAGRVADHRYRRFGHQIGPIPEDRVPEVLNRVKVFVHLPRWPEPFGRTVAEAALCGCQLLTNDNVGATTFGLDLSRSTTYEGAADEAWAAVIRSAGA